MSLYILRLGEVLAEILEHARGAETPQFAGYCANMTFWLSEYEHIETITRTYTKRLNVMRKARANFMAETGALSSCDDCGDPYQSVKPTTTGGDRQRMLARIRTALRQIIERARKLEIIDVDELDEFFERLSRNTN